MGLKHFIETVEGDIKKRMDNNNQDVRLDLDKPEDETTDTTVEQESENLPSDFKPHGEVDPSFNCQACKGEGMIFNEVWPEGKLCQDCLGTGKVGE